MANNAYVQSERCVCGAQIHVEQPTSPREEWAANAWSIYLEWREKHRACKATP